MEQCDKLGSSVTSVMIPHGLTWFRSCSTSTSSWTDDVGCDMAFISYEFVNIYKLCYMKSDETSGYYFSFVSRFKAHEQNVHSVSFPTKLFDGPLDKSLITCGNDRALRIWSNEHPDAYKLDREIQLGQDIVPNSCSACVVSGSLCILSASLTGHIIIWEPFNSLSPSNPLITKFSKLTASCCVWMPRGTDGKNLLAVVGFISGDICAYNYDRSLPMNKNSCCQTFKISAHNFEVCSIVPVSNSADERQCFVSAGRDAEIRLWSLDDMQCKYSHRFKVHQKDNNNAQVSTGGHGKAWIPIASTGIESPRFLAFDTNGNLYSFNAIDKPQSCDSTVSSLRHTGLVFSLISIPGSPHLFLSFGKDSQIIAWKRTYNDWQTLTPVASIPCVPGRINCLSQAPGLYSPLAVGLSDGTLLIFRSISPPEPNSLITVNRLLPLPPSTAAIGISALAWHPDPLSANLIAIGSSKGHVDIIDVLKNQNRGRNFNHLGGCIYRVTWGPKLFASSEEEGTVEIGGKLLVYAVVNGCIYLLISTKTPPLNITPKFTSLLQNSNDHKLAEITFKRMPEEGITSYSWLVGLGSMNGGVNLFGLSRIFGSLVPLSRIDIHKKCIISMVWSYHADRYWLAVSSGESFITIIDSTEQAVNPPSDSMELHQFTSCMANLQGHGSRVSALDWSPVDPDLLLSGSYDCTATVWRVGVGSSVAIANYRDHLSRIHACAWSPDIPDFVLTGENFGYLAGWRPSAQTVSAPPLSRKNKNPSAKIPSCANSEQIKESESGVEKEEKSETIRIETPLLPQSLSIKRTEPHTSRKPSLLPSLFATPGFSDISLPVLALSPPLRMQSRFEIIIDFVAYMRDPLSLDDSRILPEFDLLYGGCARRRRELVRFTESEALKHLEAASGPNKTARLDAYFSLLLWLGRGQVAARKAVEFQYTPFWLMWALEMVLKGPASRPIFSSLLESGDGSVQEIAQDDFFQHKILQLTASNEYTWASTLLVCAGRTTEAVKLLLLCGRAKEALLLFRLRLSSEANQELLSKCLSLLSEKQAHTGLPNSALAFLAAGEIDKAVSAVRGNSDSNLPALDRMVALWTSVVIIPSSPVIPVRLVQACIAYAANLSIEDERRRFIEQWRLALSSNENAQYLLTCASFILLSEWQEASLNLSLLGEGIDKLARVVFDRQPSLEEAECIAGVVLDFGIATLDEKYTPNFERSLDILKHNHSGAFFTLAKRLSLRKLEPTIPSTFVKICDLF
nr:gem-associated protein 5 (gemin5) putative [Hymenolepis microstoma]